MKIIDFERKGNLIRFYLGEFDPEHGWSTLASVSSSDEESDYWGDDWDDIPYEHNAGSVYPEYIKGYRDVTFDFDDIVLEPSVGKLNSSYSKKDMKDRKIPCLIVIKPEQFEKCDSYFDRYDFDFWVKRTDCTKFYFGDELER